MLRHTITVAAWAPETGDLGAEEAISHSGSTSIQCNAQPLTYDQAVRQYGLELRGAWKFFIPVADAGSVRHGDRVTYGSFDLKVEIPQVVHEQGLLADYAAFVAVQVRQDG
jgi:hypothetical protein